MRTIWKSAAAGAAGLLLGTALVGGSTGALWADTADATAGTITTGNLQLIVGQWQWQTLPADQPEDIAEPSEFPIRKGDRIHISRTHTAHLTGDNMRAVLDLGASATPTEGFSVTYSVSGGADQGPTPIDQASSIPVQDGQTLTVTIEAIALEDGYPLTLPDQRPLLRQVTR